MTRNTVLRVVRGTVLNPGGGDSGGKNRQNMVVWGLLFAKQHSAFVVTLEEAVITQLAGESLTHRSGLRKDKPEATDFPGNRVVSTRCHAGGEAACLEVLEAGETVGEPQQLLPSLSPGKQPHR